MWNKKITIDVPTAIVSIILCYFGLSCYYLIKPSYFPNDGCKCLTYSPESHNPRTNYVIPCKEGHVWSECPPCIQQKVSCPSTSSSCVGNVTIKEPITTCKNYKRTYLRYGAEDQFCPFQATNYESWTSMPPLCDYLNLECVGSNLMLGMGPNGKLDIVQKSFSDFMFIEYVLNSRPHLANFTEVGTRHGVYSMYLGLISKLRGGQMISFDRDDWRLLNIKKSWLDNMMFKAENVLKSVNDSNYISKDLIQAIQKENSFTIYDGDDHKKEITRYIQYHRNGSIFLSHDVGDTILTSWIQPELKRYGFRELYSELAEMLGSHMRAFEKIRDDSFSD